MRLLSLVLVVSLGSFATREVLATRGAGKLSNIDIARAMRGKPQGTVSFFNGNTVKASVRYTTDHDLTLEIAREGRGAKRRSYTASYQVPHDQAGKPRWQDTEASADRSGWQLALFGKTASWKRTLRTPGLEVVETREHERQPGARISFARSQPLWVEVATTKGLYIGLDQQHPARVPQCYGCTRPATQ